MTKKINFLDIPLDAITMEETIVRAEESIFLRKHIHHCVLNAGKIILMQKDPVLRESVLSSNLINADGMSVVWAARFLGHNVPERVTGIDLMEKLVEFSFKKKYTCFFFGAEEKVVKKLVDDYSKKYSSDLVAGYHNGFYNMKQESQIIEQIKQTNPNILFVAMTSPKKENFLNKYKKELIKVNFIMGVGGSFDVISGKVTRAPRFLQEIGLEWMFRLFQEPRRMWKRYLVGNFRFIFLVLKFKIKKELTSFSL